MVVRCLTGLTQSGHVNRLLVTTSRINTDSWCHQSYFVRSELVYLVANQATLLVSCCHYNAAGYSKHARFDVVKTAWKLFSSDVSITYWQRDVYVWSSSAPYQNNVSNTHTSSECKPKWVHQNFINIHTKTTLFKSHKFLDVLANHLKTNSFPASQYVDPTLQHNTVSWNISCRGRHRHVAIPNCF